MTKKTGGASQPSIETYESFFDGFIDTVGDVAVPLTDDYSITCYQVLVQSEPSNTANIRVGTATSQSVLLRPGEVETLPFCGRLSEIYVRAPGATNQRVNWHVMR